MFVPRGKANLASYVGVDSDPTSDNYGNLELLELTDQGTDGPGLISNQFNQDQDVRKALLKFQQSGSPPRYGNLLTLPVDGGFIYIEPIYAVTAGSTTGYPILQYVVVSYDKKVGIGRNLSDALINALGATAPEPTGNNGDGNGNGGNGNGNGNGGATDLPVNQQIRDLLTRADTAFTKGNAALAKGDLATYQAQFDKAQKLVRQAVSLADLRDATGATPGQ